MEVNQVTKLEAKWKHHLKILIKFEQINNEINLLHKLIIFWVGKPQNNDD